MHHTLTTLLLATSAALSLAAPTPTKAQPKHAFKARAKGHKLRTPKEAMTLAYRKYGVELRCSDENDQNPFAALESLFPPTSSTPWWAAEPSIIVLGGSSGAVPSATAPASGFGYGGSPSSIGFFGSSSAAGFPAPSGAPASSGFPAPSGAAPSSGVPAPSGGAPSSGVPIHSGQPSGQPSSPPASSTQPAPSSTPSSPSSGSGSSSGSVAANPEPNDASYVEQVTIGGQQFGLDFDTGSSDLWVLSTQMPSSETAGHEVFNSAKSPTFQPYQGGSWQISYGDGSSASGTVGFDTVTIGGVTAQKQAVELAQEASQQFLQYQNNDGLLGLAFSSINQVQPQQQKTFWENVMDQLAQPLFTVDLEQDASGFYEFGAIDSSKYSGSLHYTAVDNSQGFWSFASSTYTIAGTTKQRTGNTPTIADTGTSLVLLDNAVVKDYYSHVSGAQYDSTQGGYVYPCSTTLPDFGIAVGDYTATLSGSKLTYIQQGSQCFGGIQPAGSAGVQILGDVFLKQYFTVFNGGSLQLGVAPKA